MKKSAIVIGVLLGFLLPVLLGAVGCGGATSPSTTTAGTLSWSCLQPAGKTPLGRLGHVMTYDPELGKMILFGGWDTDGVTQFNDTWAYDPSADSWTELDTAGDSPSVRGMMDAVFCPDSGATLIFGGWGGESKAMNDLWAYESSANAWRELEPAAIVPSQRRDNTMVYVQSLGRVILFGGAEGTVPFNDTWSYDPSANVWTELHPAGESPLARVLHTMVYDPSSDKVILFGGVDESNTAMNDLWAYDPVSNTWTELHPAGDPPCARLGHAAVYDAAGARMLLFGGMDQSMSILNDLWAYDPVGNTWTELHPSGEAPPARDSHALAYDPASGKVFLFGGEGSCGALSDTWALTF